MSSSSKCVGCNEIGIWSAERDAEEPAFIDLGHTSATIYNVAIYIYFVE